MNRENNSLHTFCSPAEDPRERGTTTAEFALMLPAVVFILALVLGACAVGATQIKLEESARLGARAAARGETPETVSRIAGEIDSDFVVQVMDEGTMMTVIARTQAPGVIGALGSVEQQARASVPKEQVGGAE